MGTDYHTPWVDKPTPGYTVFSAASMNPALAELDDAISDLNDNAHIQGTDQYLDQGGPNEVSAAEIRTRLGILESGESAGSLDENIKLYPEYPGAVLTKSGSNNSAGTLGMDADSEVVSNVRHNYYEWASSESSGLQSYDVEVQIPIPDNFVGLQVGANAALTIDIKTEENTDTNNKIDVTINRDGQATISALTAQKSSSAATWETIGFDETDTVLADVQAGETLDVLIRLYSQNSKYARVGKINLAIKVQ